MQINGIKSFKVEDVDPAAGDTGSDPTAEDVGDSLDDAFGDPTGTEGTTTSSSPLDDYVINDPTATPSSGTVADSLENYPPTVEEIIAADERVLRHLDLLKARYQNTKLDLEALLQNFMNALPYVSASEAADLHRAIGYLELDIAKCDEQVTKINNLIANNERIYEQELAAGKDLNGDGYIGDPTSPTAIGVLYDDEGKIHYIDPLTGKAIRAPICDPDYSARVTNDALEMTDATIALGGLASNPNELADIYLKLKDGVITPDGEYGNGEFNDDFNTPICINIPEYLWVKKDPETGWAKENLEAEDPSYVNDASLWSDEGGLTQNIPADKSKYVQLLVAEVLVTSKESRFTDSRGNPLYDTCIELKDSEGIIITSIRITGYETEVNCPAAAQKTEGEGFFVAASSVGISFTGDQRASPIKFDASNYVSTCRHVMSDLEAFLGTDSPNGGDPRCDNAYNNTLAAFQNDADGSGNFTTHYNDVTGTTPSATDCAFPELVHDVNDGSYGDSSIPDYGTYQDRYFPDTKLTGDQDSLAMFQTGVFVSGLRGVLYGSNKGNDMFIIPGVNELSTYAEEHKLPDSEKTHKEDAFYTTVVYGGNGSNLIRAGKDKEYQGDLYADGISWGYIEATGDSTVQIKVTDEPTNEFTPEVIGSDTIVGEDPKRDPFNFVCIDGARDSVLYDFGEAYTSKNAGYEKSLDNDYFRLSGRIKVSKPGDKDFVEYERFNSTNLDESNVEAVTNMYGDLENLIWEDIAGIGAGDDEFDAGTTWTTLTGGPAAEQDALMDGFFEETFGDLNEFAVEMESEDL